MSCRGKVKMYRVCGKRFPGSPALAKSGNPEREDTHPFGLMSWFLLFFLVGGRVTVGVQPRQPFREPVHRRLELRVQVDEIAQPLGDTELPVWPEAGQANIFDGRTHIAVVSRRPARTIVAMVKWLDEHGIELSDIRIKRPSLEEAFIELTGKSLRE